MSRLGLTLLSLVLVGCRLGCPGEVEVQDVEPEAASVSVSQAPDALLGANRARLSPNGRYAGLEYQRGTMAPLVVRVDLTGELTPISAAGRLAGAPTAEGALPMISESEGSFALGTLPQGLTLPVSGGPWRAVGGGDEPVWAYGPADDGTGLELIRWEAGEAQTALVDLPGTSVDHVLVGPHGVYVLANLSQTASRPTALTGSSILCLDPEALTLRWRQDHIEPEPLFSQGKLALFDRGAKLVAMSGLSHLAPTFDAQTGQAGELVELPKGMDSTWPVHTLASDKQAWLVQQHKRRPAGKQGGWRLVALGAEGARIVHDAPNERPPLEVLRTPSGVQIIPWEAPRWPDPATWGEHLTRYLNVPPAASSQ